MLDPQPRRGPIDSAAAYAHPGSRASVLSQYQAGPPPVVMEHQYQQRYHPHPHPHHHPHPHQHPHYNHPQHPPHGGQYARRVPSINTSMTGPPASYGASPTTDIRRSSSSRSGGVPTSYVAALRRQKGTVWSDRAQPEDPARAAQLRAAKARATRTMAGSGRLSVGHGGSGRTSTGISTTGKVAAKIRHHGKPGVVGYAPGENHVGVGGVPPRLSATEVEGESSGDEERERMHHRRTGSSGRSSTGSGRRNMPIRSGPGSQRGTPSRQGSIAESIQERPPLVVVGGLPSDPVSGRTRSVREGKAQSIGSGSSAERVDGVAELDHDPTIASNSRLAADLAREKEKGKGGLERKGSVDERTSTLSAGRLYIANPD